MCIVSNIGDAWKETFPKKWPNFPDVDPLPQPHIPYSPTYTPPGVSQSDFEALRKEVQELKKLLEAAKKFDEATGQPHCEIEDKVELIKRIAKMVGVDLGDVFAPAQPKKTKRKSHP
jgi:hypothetical protein